MYGIDMPSTRARHGVPLHPKQAMNLLSQTAALAAARLEGRLAELAAPGQREEKKSGQARKNEGNRSTFSLAVHLADLDLGPVLPHRKSALAAQRPTGLPGTPTILEEKWGANQ